MSLPTIDEILAIAEKYQQENVVDGYYIECDEGGDDGVDYCKGCAKKQLEQYLKLDPTNKMYRSARDCHSDSRKFCETCGNPLFGWLTDYGALEIVENVSKERPWDLTNPSDCYDFYLCDNQWPEHSEEYKMLMRSAGYLFLETSGELLEEMDG